MENLGLIMQAYVNFFHLAILLNRVFLEKCLFFHHNFKRYLDSVDKTCRLAEKVYRTVPHCATIVFIQASDNSNIHETDIPKTSNWLKISLNH